MILKPAVLRCLVPAVGTLLLILSPPLLAQQDDQQDSANERINFAGKLRMLSQRAGASGCNINADIDAENNRQILSATSAEYWKILDGLEFGNADLNINGEETDDTVLAALQTTKTQWQSFEELVLKMANAGASTFETELVDTQNLELLQSAQNLVESILASYSDPAVADTGFGKVIDIAGRQRMLTQKMSKEACQIWSGQDSDEKAKTLQATMALFENSMISLRDGTDGLIKPPNDRIKQGLNGVWQQWNDAQPSLQNALSKQAIESDARKELSNKFNQMLRDMNFVVGLYAVAEKEQGNIVDNGATERINFSGKLRMLSQRVAAASCNFTAGVDTEKSRAILISAQAEFAKIAQALEFGDADLRINGEEKRRKTLDAVAKLREEWNPMNAAVDNLLNGENVEENAALISEKNMLLLEAAKILVSEISGEYSDPTLMMQSDAILVDISGRQRMLTQKMSKETCLLWSGQTAMADELSGTIEMFDVSLQALREGLETAGVKAAPTVEIAAGLDGVLEKWQTVKPILDKASSSENTDLAQRGQLVQELDSILSEMNTIVGMYTIHGKTGL